MTRAERYAQVVALKAQGLNGIEIATRLGLGRSTVYDLLSDPTGDAVRERKRRRRGICRDCGCDTFNSGSEPPERCKSCAEAHKHETRYWTRERIVTALRAFHAEHGRVPAVADFSVAHARHSRAVKCALAHGPDPATCIREFGSWNAAIEAAGFPTKPGAGVYYPRLVGA